MVHYNTTGPTGAQCRVASSHLQSYRIDDIVLQMLWWTSLSSWPLLYGRQGHTTGVHRICHISVWRRDLHDVVVVNNLVLKVISADGVVHIRQLRYYCVQWLSIRHLEGRSSCFRYRTWSPTAMALPLTRRSYPAFCRRCAWPVASRT
jgi:hypothetical protein